ncbi:MAG: transposase, partial [Tindallia sp. MSAO_Bac2]
MLKKNDGQVDLFDSVIFDRLIPKDHLLVKIDSIIDFSFVYDLVENRYSPIGRGSKDPVMMVKILLLEYLYNLSDVEVCRQIQTDIVFRWFLGLGIFDEIPDDTTVSHFRVCRLTEDHFEAVFNQILQKCIQYDLVKTKRYIIDSTDVAANTNYPSEKNLVRQAFRKVMKEASLFNEPLANQLLESIEADIQALYDQSDDPVHWKQHFEITKMYLDKLYLETYEELQHNESYAAAYRLCYDLIDQYQKKAKDKIVSITDPDARVAHKSPGNIKRGYKNHLIADEDRRKEIIF